MCLRSSCFGPEFRRAVNKTALRYVSVSFPSFFTFCPAGFLLQIASKVCKWTGVVFITSFVSLDCYLSSVSGSEASLLDTIHLLPRKARRINLLWLKCQQSSVNSRKPNSNVTNYEMAFKVHNKANLKGDHTFKNAVFCTSLYLYVRYPRFERAFELEWLLCAFSLLGSLSVWKTPNQVMRELKSP